MITQEILQKLDEVDKAIRKQLGELNTSVIETDCLKRARTRVQEAINELLPL